MKLNNTEQAFLRILLMSNRSLESFTLFKRMKISFSEFSSTLRLLKTKSLVEEKENRIYLSEDGIRVAFLEKTVKTERKWRDIPIKMQGKKHETNEPYIPNISKLDINFFPLAIKFLKK
ncbi:hypothetical protein ACK3Z9_07265 [Aeromonas caviae]|jgi:hypothetical protein|uniref:hypothetical protein n=1 Tax=Aeromonas TaxID=642 RepID=UPI0006A6005A|nr:hypothetical protein [Aeromonas caviae]KOG94010.1 hypothetical protein AL345_06895 [Aeromonas caviae]MCY9808925.1 hypothetical protein [Aeromonas caviae]MDX7716795.1 hypothetical protein [Aeromonas caviae]NAZ60415.1 hypothetical protein [Aeromonas caviae]QLL89440.1 hypothetical protein GWG10_15335 [Aeromonas caviae]